MRHPLENLKGLPIEDLDITLGSYKKKYKEPMADRAWRFELTLSVMAPESVKSSLYEIIKYMNKADDPPVTFEIRCERQSQTEQEL